MVCGKDTKKVVFYENEKKHADFKIRLHYDGLGQSEFFRAIIAGYINQDEGLLNYIARYQEEHGKHSKAKRAESKRLLSTGAEVTKKFGLGERDIEDIFDLLEKENPDL
jgi:hypothetical protein